MELAIEMTWKLLFLRNKLQAAFAGTLRELSAYPIHSTIRKHAPEMFSYFARRNRGHRESIRGTFGGYPVFHVIPHTRGITAQAYELPHK